MKQWFRVVRSRVGVCHSPAVRLCLAADIERYSRFTNVEAAPAQERFIEVLGRALAQAGLMASEVDVQRSGDGQFIVFPPGLDESAVLPNLVTGLTFALRQTNAGLSSHARLRLRVALHRGLLRPHVNGWIGDSAIAAHRLLNSAPVRAALAREPVADFVLVISDTLYRDVIAHGYPGLPPEQFRQVLIDIPAKGFTEHAWISLGRRWATGT